ncbi:DNA polymerase III gamma and tau subunits [Mesoplasma florum L1]|uniref:DNA polymerase III subunit gamma/tau n=1 Tax=Mesoplasma florum (strain ATCC 33453 / NBRC 100688 / NCTC 11704 / L1) TaxID=265311 RepID=Q6F0D9_MESFL|nr:DNA polymerase III subunit gamma/tau [Mesoplasma florum]AAT76034.1 DNA polymerase III gamma and tau subunits [Mesoplasma florum L1]ATI73632.1 DNA polymerase III, subunit gamma and tau [Mesoplasma florum]AVN62025.1 DNA polymerase III, subunit gamma and tau [Mesoplasma florum]
MEQNKALYRKYRPSNFGDIAGHQNVVEILKNELKNNKISHSFLFAGQRGTGKTSIARILAKSVNCLNIKDGLACEVCESCIASNEQRNPDIIEMDAASNNGVDEIREIKNNINSLPFIGKYKIYIIDEVHMLTKAAFNALLKTLEEPPVHAIFILATTEYAKIPATILSRCQIFNFKKIDRISLMNRLSFICENEGYKIDKAVLEEIAIISEGSLRDASNVIEQLMTVTSDHITVEDLKSVFYVATKNEKMKILTNILNNDPATIINYFEKANNQGMDFDVFTLSLIEIVKEIIEFKFTNDENVLNILDKSDLNEFAQVNVKSLFEVADNLSEAYAKTKGTNINFNYLLISLLKTLKEPTEHKIKIEESVLTIQENIIVKEVIAEPVHIQEPEKQILIEKVEEIKEEVIEQPIKTFEEKITQVKDIEIKEESVSIDDDYELKTLTNLKIQLNKNLVDNEEKKTYKVEINEVINLLVGANKNKREDIENKINSFFKVDEQDNLLNPDLAKKYINFFNFKVIAASQNEILLRADDFENVNNLLVFLQNEEYRESIQKEFGKALFLPIDETLWNEVKISFKRLKENNQLPSYEEINYDSYFDKKKQSMVLSHFDDKTIEAASRLFNIDELEIED